MRKDTKERDFDRQAKLAIMRRDMIDGWPCCVYCGAAAPSDESPVWSNAHFIARSQLGKGIPENGLTLCPECHRRYDQTTARMRMRDFFREYLKRKHDDWNEDKLIQRRAYG